MEKIALFENSVINELKDAISHFSFKVYEESFKKIEIDMETVYKEVMTIREDYETRIKEVEEWKQKLGVDLENFYSKFDKQLEVNNHITKDDKEIWSNTIIDVSDNVSKSKNYPFILLFRLEHFIINS